MNQTKNTSKGEKRWRSGREASSKVDLSSMVYGKVPPQAKSLESVVLGAILLEKGAFDVAGSILQADFFYIDAHQRIFRAMRRTNEKSIPIDILTVVEELKLAGDLEAVGGPFYVTKLTNSVVSSANIEAHARIIQQKFIQRELIRISGEIIGKAYEDTTDVFELLDQAETGLFSISTGHLKSEYSKIDTLYRKETDELELRMQTKGEEVTGVPTGSKPLDVITGGWQPTDLIIIAARPSVGKTAFALNLARNAALHPKKPTGVAVFCLEMSSGQVTQRLISAESEIPLDKIRRGKMDTPELQALHRSCVNTIARAPIYIDDSGGLNIFELRAKCRRLVNTQGVGLIIIDYLQLMSGTDERTGNREQEISKISRSLKNLAKELHVPVIALSQMSRDVEKRKDGSRMPQLSDLRESGAIEQDADMVVFLARVDYQKESGDIDPSMEGDTEFIIRKHRNGKLETIAFKADLSIQRFTDVGTPMERKAEEVRSKFIPRREAERRFAIEQPPAPAEDPFDELPF